MMAQETSEASVVSTSSSVPNWWDVQMNSVSSSAAAAAAAAGWSHHMHSWQISHHPNSNNSCEDQDISISTTSFMTNASNNSGLSADSAATPDLSGELPAENHLWNQVLLGVGNVDGDPRNTHNNDVGENFLEVLSSRNLQSTTDHMPEPACNYLKKLESNWGFTAGSTTPSCSTLNNLEKQMGTYINGGFADHEKLHNLSDLVNNWSIAPPSPQLSTSPCSNSMGASNMARYYFDPNNNNFSHVKHGSSTTSPYGVAGTGGAGDVSSGGLPCYGNQMRLRERLHHEFGSVDMESSLPRPISTGHASGYHIGLGNPAAAGSFNKYCSGGASTAPDHAPWSAATTRSLSDLVSFGSCSLSKPLIDFRGSNKPTARSSDAAADHSRKHGHDQTSPIMIRGGTGNHPGVTSEGKKKRSEVNSETHVKKSKQESSAAPSAKLQVPKVKQAEKITALQQIVAPFGKTDTASVLMETINYIRFLHEQVQLLSNPYTKTGGNKDHCSWGGLERKDRQEHKADLKSRGLCLVPVSSTPQIYRENNGPDYWTPPYRGCLYR